MNRSSEIRKRKKRFLSFTLALVMSLGTLCGLPCEVEGEESARNLNYTIDTNTVWASGIITVDGKDCDLTKDVSNLTVNAKLTIKDNTTIGNDSMPINAQNGSVLVSSGALICKDFTGKLDNASSVVCETFSGELTNTGSFFAKSSFNNTNASASHMGTVQLGGPKTTVKSAGGSFKLIYVVPGEEPTRTISKEISEVITNDTPAWMLTDPDTSVRPEIGIYGDYKVVSGKIYSKVINDDKSTAYLNIIPVDDTNYCIGLEKSSDETANILIDESTYTNRIKKSDFQFFVLKKNAMLYNLLTPDELTFVDSNGNTVDFENGIIFDGTKPKVTVEATADGVDYTSKFLALKDGDVIEAKKLELKITAEDDNLMEFCRGVEGEDIDSPITASSTKQTVTFNFTADTNTLNKKSCYYQVYDKAGNVTSFGFKLQYPRLKPNVSVSCDDIYVDGTIKPVVTTEPSSLAENVTYEYKKKGESDSSYSSEVPTKVGEYTLKVTTKENSEYNSNSATCSFKILKKKVSSKVTIADAYVGEKYEPKVTVDPVVDVKAKYMYKASGTPDDAYSTTKPTKAGTYYVKAILSYDTDKYEMLDCESSFKISKKKPKSSVKISEQKEGKDYKPTLTTDSDGKSKAVFEYKKKDADDSTYSKTKPTSHGSYTVRASIPETDKYLAATCEADFVITKVDDKNDSIIYQLSGDKGKNGYYKSDVYIVAPKGYKFATSKDGKYNDKIQYTSDLKKIYVKRTSDGEILDPIDFNDEIKIDKELPKLSGTLNGEAVSLSDGKELFADNLTISISDENLAKVTLDGEDVSVDNKTVTLQLDSEMGEKTFNITTEDEAGNENNIKLVLKSEWLKNKVIPIGKKVKLRVGDVYKLEPGTWVVVGDSTVYNGGQEFFVTSSGDYTFEKQ